MPGLGSSQRDGPSQVSTQLSVVFSSPALEDQEERTRELDVEYDP